MDFNTGSSLVGQFIVNLLNSITTILGAFTFLAD